MPDREKLSPDKQDTHTSNSPASTGAPNQGNGSNKRKRGTGASSRGVANLTPEQLERKRANDREAQRAIRERTKQQIDRLNQRIQELESSQPYRDLQVVIRQKETVQAENDEIKRQLASFVSLFQRFLPGSQGLEDLAAAAERNSIPYSAAEHPQSLVTHSDPHGYPLPPIADNASPHVSNSAPSPTSQSSHMNRSYPYPNVGPTSHIRGTWPNANSTFDPQSRNIHPDLAYPHNDERLGVEFLLESNRLVRAGANGVSPPSYGNGGHSGDNTSGAYAALPRSSEATCPLDAILLDAVAERRRLFATGATSETVIGPAYPNFNAMLIRNTTHFSHPLSKVLTDILRTFPDLSNLPEQVAVVYIMFLIMRWEVEPSKENYDRLPDWCRPLPNQLFTPHPCWLDYLPWPRLRDMMVQANPVPHFDTFFVPYTTSLSLNWPYAPADVLLPSATPMPAAQSPGSNNSGMSDEPVWRMNPAFETHLRDLGNWSLGPPFREVFPELAGTVRIKEGDR